MPRTRAHDADLVILGAGCAGLALAARLAEGDSGLRVIAVDVRTDYADDRSWCFWAAPDHELRSIVHREWGTWAYQAEGGPAHEHGVDGTTYQYIRGADFYARCRAIIDGSPTVDAADATPSIPGVVVAGAAGGALRDASGYGFARIQAWARDCADRLARGEAPAGHPPEPFVRRQMDRIFLQALRAHPERTADYFAAMARGVAPARLLRFLTDRARLSDLLAIIASLPLLPFLAQLPDRSRALATSSARRPDLVRALPRVYRAPAPEPEPADQVA